MIMILQVVKKILDDPDPHSFYETLLDDDLSKPIVYLIHRLPKELTYLDESQKKSSSISTTFREMGNIAFHKEQYGEAFTLYNKALSFAPKDSKEMLLAYSNRSALLLKVHAYKDALQDIEVCLRMDCPDNIISKLKVRMQGLDQKVRELDLKIKCIETSTRNYFKWNCKRNSQIPSASADIDVIHDSKTNTWKVIATSDIKAGTLVSLEKAYVTYTSDENKYNTCYYCQKMCLTLMPCNGCCHALFCSNECKNLCYKEYHKIECKIFNIIKQCKPKNILALRATLKFKMQCNSWKEFVVASFNTGLQRIKDSTIKEIYDPDSRYSLLNIRDDKPFVFGSMFIDCIIISATINGLQRMTSFFPDKEPDRHQAICGFARILMFLTTFNVNMPVLSACMDTLDFSANYPLELNRGIFTFADKIEKSCCPNIIPVNLKNKLVLVTAKTVKKGTELKVPHIYNHHIMGTIPHYDANEQLIKFKLNGTVCQEICCSGRLLIDKLQQLNADQKMAISYLVYLRNSKLLSLVQYEQFIEICKALDILSDVPYSAEYDDILTIFIRFLLFYGCVASENFAVRN